jgi:hypothetical protein
MLNNRFIYVYQNADILKNYLKYFFDQANHEKVNFLTKKYFWSKLK